MANSQPAQQTRRSRRSPWANRAVFAVALLGLTLFVLARFDVAALPFDQHHLITQFVGVALVLGALTKWR